MSDIRDEVAKAKTAITQIVSDLAEKLDAGVASGEAALKEKARIEDEISKLNSQRVVLVKEVEILAATKSSLQKVVAELKATLNNVRL